MTQPTLKPKPVPRSEQDQKIANLITQTQQLIGTARDNTDIASLLSTRGYDMAALAEGLALQQAAQAAFTARQTAIAAQKQATAARDGADTTARQTYADFRETARAIFTASAARTALGLNGKVPDDTQKFITTARASYTTAQSALYAATFAAYGYPAAALTAALATLDTLAGADQAQNAAIGAALKTTADRDAAVKALQTWARQFKRLAKVALRQNPALAKKLEL